jgi:uncharacterized membrane protein (DUF106 family)
MLLKLELARGQASLAGWVVSKPAQCTSAAYTTEEVAAQQEQHKQLRRCKRTQRQQDQRNRELSQVQVKPGVVVHEGLLVLFLRLQAARLAVNYRRNANNSMASPTPDFGVSCTNSVHLTRRSNSG